MNMKWLKQQTLFKKDDHIENWALKSKEEKKSTFNNGHILNLAIKWDDIDGLQ